METQQSIPSFDNQAAHNELKKLMEKGTILELFFSIDKEGYRTIRVKELPIKGKEITSPTIEYRLNEEAVIWLINYLVNGFTDDSDVNPLQPIDPIKGVTGDEWRLFMLETLLKKILIKLKLIDIQKEVNKAITRNHESAYYMNFRFGIIRFFFKKDNGVKKLLKEKQDDGTVTSTLII